MPQTIHREDREESHFQGSFFGPLHMHLFPSNFLLSDSNFNCRGRNDNQERGKR